MTKRVQKVVYEVTQVDSNRLLIVLKAYYQFYGDGSCDPAELASEAFDNLIRGRNLEGGPPGNISPYLDERINELTKYFYTPSPENRKKYKLGVTSKKTRKTELSIADPNNNRSALDENKVNQIKDNLVSEYPHLKRKDLSTAVDNYAKLQVKLSTMLDASSGNTETNIKNIIEAMTKLGNYLGIDESAKQKQKSLEDRQSIAALSMQFQDTISEYPEIIDRLRFEELMIMLEKYERKELDREMFQIQSYAGITIEEAYNFVNQRKEQYV